jgi:hypothetical protein
MQALNRLSSAVYVLMLMTLMAERGQAAPATGRPELAHAPSESDPQGSVGVLCPPEKARSWT